MKNQFVRFEGCYFVNSRAVAVYKTAGGVVLQEEADDGKKIGRPVRLPESVYESMRDEWARGCLSNHEGDVAQRALDYVRGCND